ncbi:hypothetical protein Tco_1539767, partial [Tanacetum coccineum]
MSLSSLCNADHAGCQDSRKVLGKVLIFLEIDWLLSSKKQRSTAISTTEAELHRMSGCCAHPWIDSQLNDYGFDFITIPLHCDNKSAILYCWNNSNTLALNTSTYGTISSESKWKIEWLNSTSWKRIISLQTFSPKHYQENGSNFASNTPYRRVDPETLRRPSRRRVIINRNVVVLAMTSDLQPGMMPGLDYFISIAYGNMMAEQNVPAQAPTRTDEQIVPRSQWLQIGKSNLLFDAQKIQKNPIFQISIDILRNTNFFRVFSASASVPAVYIQQFWNSIKYDEKTGALDITPVDPAHPFELPPTGDTVIDFINQLGYPEPVEFVSNIRVNYVYQPWRAILTLINQCLTRKTSGGDKPRHPVLQMLWGIVTQTNVDHAELLWEEFTQGIQTFFSYKASQKASLKDPKKKVVPLLIPYGRFTKMIIYYLGSTSDVHKRPESPCHLLGDDFLLALQQSTTIQSKLGHGWHKNPKKNPQRIWGLAEQPEPATKRAYPRRPQLLLLKGKPSFQLFDEDDECPQEPQIPQEKVMIPDLELAKKKDLLDAHQEKGEGEGADADIERANKLSWNPSFCYKKVVYESSSNNCFKRTESGTEAAAPKGDKEQGEVASSIVTSGVGISVRTEDQAGSDPGKAHEALAGPDPEPMQEDQTGSDSGKVHVSLAGPNPEHMDEEFLATAYPKVHENLKLITDEHVIEDNPESHSGSMSSMKNLEDTDNFGDQFLYDKPTEDDQEKSKVVDESDSTIPDPSHQTVTSTPPVIAPIIDFSSPKPSLQVTTPPINTEATSITTTLPEITPFIALQLRVAKLEQDMSEVKKTDHSAAVMASIKSQVPTVVDKYLGTKLDDALLRILERHTADLIEKYFVLPGPKSIKNQESKKSPKEIIKIKKEQGEKKQESTYTIRSTDKVALEEFDLKNALFKHMNKNRTANRNHANYHLYHALMEA